MCAHRCLSSLLWSLFAIPELRVTDDTHIPCFLAGLEAPGVDSGLGVCVICAQVYGTDLHRRLSISPALNIHLWCAGGGGAGIPNLDADDNLKLNNQKSVSHEKESRGDNSSAGSSHLAAGVQLTSCGGRHLEASFSSSDDCTPFGRISETKWKWAMCSVTL